MLTLKNCVIINRYDVCFRERRAARLAALQADKDDTLTPEPRGALSPPKIEEPNEDMVKNSNDDSSVQSRRKYASQEPNRGINNFINFYERKPRNVSSFIYITFNS